MTKDGWVMRRQQDSGSGEEHGEQDVIDLAPDGRKVDFYADDGKSLIEKAFSKEPNASGRVGRVEVREPGLWGRLRRFFSRLSWKLRG